ncbi:hypothetical protein ACFQ0K_08460 [Nocardioides caeni]|uniref:Uncharacterized protein n=1 Tax=Nocardioides caeni TaxID=574700 RepID=A0A4S8N383_9ACTN|nr:hypothetical protein [Nocardioides caeni]THV10438.1 hypothetical protein E9934_13965 [Nocardioides caeni]
MHFTEQPDLRVRMTTFVSTFADAEDEWPHAWTLVEVEPAEWSCTVPVHELVQILRTGSADADLRRLPHHWHGDDLTLELGPAAITGSAEDWLVLCRRLIDAAESAEGVSELPDTRPWPGERFPFSMESIEIAGKTPPAPPSLSPVERLALAGGFEPREFVELFGAGWVEWEDTHTDAVRFHDGLFLWGTPAQLAATTDAGPGGLAVGVPCGMWSGPAHLGYELTDPTPVSRDLTDEEIRAVVKPLLARRRRSFTWCRYCGDRLAPEHRFEPTVCYGCATEWFGIVY